MVDSFGDVLRQLREDRGWSLGQLAERVRWSKPLVSFVETSRRHPSVDFALACDQVFGTFPILTTLCGLDGRDDHMKRRALVSGFSAALGMGAMGAYAALAESIRLDLQEAADIEEDWDGSIQNFQRRLVMEPDARFGDELLASVLTARQRLSEHRDADSLRASAHLALLYAIWMGYMGNVGTGQNYYRTAATMAERSGDTATHVYVLARTAAAGPYQGLTQATTERNIAQALALADGKPSTGALEAYAARVHLAALSGDLAGGRAAIGQMWRLVDVLPEPQDGPTPAQRTVSFNAYLEGRLGSMADAQQALIRADEELGSVPQWLIDARVYHGLALVRHGSVVAGLRTTLAAAQDLKYSVRVIRLGVDDVLQALPPGYRSDLSEELRQHGTTGPKPWELVTG